MNKQDILQKVYDHVKSMPSSDVAAHDWWHVKRVYDMAMSIQKSEGGDIFIIGMIALLHDVYDHKFYGEVDQREAISGLLYELDVLKYIDEADLDNIVYSIEHLSFKGSHSEVERSLEGKIAQDADRLDAIGAIAIARTFAYGGKMNRPLYDPEVGIIEVKTPEEYARKDRHSVNHFYEKLLKLKDYMNTQTGKAIAQQRHQFMESYLEQFFNEWEGKC